MVLSKRWGLVWTMVPKLKYKDTRKEGDKSVWCLLDKSLQLNKAPVLESLHIQVEHQFSDNADVGKCVSYAVDHNVRVLALYLPIQPKILLLPSNVYTSKTLVKLTLSCRTLVVDVPSLPCLPSLQTLDLLNVVYKDENTQVRLLSNCPALRRLEVLRNSSDNVTTFIVKVPSLKTFRYMQHKIDSAGRSLVLDSPGLRHLTLTDPDGDLDSIQNMPHLDWAYVLHYVPYPKDDKFLRSFSSVTVLHLSLRNVECCSAIKFSRLMMFTLHLCCFDDFMCSLEPLMLFLHISPILKLLKINYDMALCSSGAPVSWNRPSSVPACLLSHLEIFVWEEFGGRRQEGAFVVYILANSKCLKTAGFSPRYNLHEKEKEKMMVLLKSMYRASPSSQVVRLPNQAD
ncbi:putative F-box/FBD/LRR-repeat protein At1g22000 [Raphanus sativus]|uniref:F-box/FBD/LRR-repeat protein At1g22000 n=1 Tax=Raphanus sativus TaxID=3726 RepID=A0A6J0NY29_RAPSA|nr:putative F-box/FBD/LRR-repeat protein At1g22000 [Raphanus sativus]